MRKSLRCSGAAGRFVGIGFGGGRGSMIAGAFGTDASGAGGGAAAFDSRVDGAGDCSAAAIAGGSTIGAAAGAGASAAVDS
jgi:hypothetical protein